MQIFVKNHNSRTMVYEVEKSDSVESLIEKVCDKEGYKPRQFWLTFSGKSLCAGRSLADYLIDRESTIYVNIRAHTKSDQELKECVNAT
jgi:hypothetical protein